MMFNRRYLLLGWVVVIVGCAATGNYTYKLYPGPKLSKAELATVEFGSRLEHVVIDGLNVHRSEYGKVLLLPGEHTFAFNGISISAQLEKGHQYLLLGTDVWPFCCADPVIVSGREVHRWIQNADTGAIVGEIKEP